MEAASAKGCARFGQTEDQAALNHPVVQEELRNARAEDCCGHRAATQKTTGKASLSPKRF